MKFHTAEANVTDLFDNYHHQVKFLELCKTCKGYGNSWSCPPLDSTYINRIRKFRKALVTAIEISVEPETPVSEAEIIMAPAKKKLADYLLDAERTSGGIASCTIGHCPYCDPLPCSRIENKPCRHPEFMRPSPEALGFDLSNILKNVFGFKLEWATDSFLPPRLYIVGALFCD